MVAACARALSFPFVRSDAAELDATSTLPSVGGSTLARAVFALLGLALLSTSGGCPGSNGPRLGAPLLTTTDAAAESDLRAADRAAEEGRSSDAETLYRAFLSEHAEDPTLPLAELGLGRVLLADGRTEEALPHFDTAIESTDEVVAERGRFYRGVSLHLSGRSAEALDLLQPLRGRTVDPEETALLLRTLAAASTQVGDHAGALRALSDLNAASTGAEAADVRQQMETLIDEMPPEALERAFVELPRERDAWQLVALRALRVAYDAGQVERVRELAAALRERDVPVSEDVSTMVLRAERTTTADPRVIGAILPLSGRAREIGQRALRGLMLAAGSPPEGPPDADAAQLVFRDDASDPERAARAVEELVSTHRAIAIIGPLDGPGASAAAARAAQLGVPMITLAPSEIDNPSVFRLFPTASDELRALARAAAARGARRIAVLHPENRFGEGMLAALRTVAQEVGSEVVVAVSYPATTTAFGAQITTLARSQFDALLIADASTRVALLAPALAAEGIWPQGTPAGPRITRQAVYIMPSVAFDPRLAQSAGRYLQGALFSVPFHAPTATGEARNFADAFMARYQAEPDVFAAYAYDAFLLVRRGVTSGASTRPALFSWLGAGSQMETAGASSGLSATRAPRDATRILTLSGELFSVTR